MNAHAPLWLKEKLQDAQSENARLLSLIDNFSKEPDAFGSIVKCPKCGAPELVKHGEELTHCPRDIHCWCSHQNVDEWGVCRDCLSFVGDDSVELWKPVPNSKDYEVSTRGRIRSYRAPYTPSSPDAPRRKKVPKLMKPRFNKYFLTSTICDHDNQRRPWALHVLLAETFFEPRKGRVIAMIDGDVTNVHLSNIRIEKRVENRLWKRSIFAYKDD